MVKWKEFLPGKVLQFVFLGERLIFEIQVAEFFRELRELGIGKIGEGGKIILPPQPLIGVGGSIFFSASMWGTTLLTTMSGSSQKTSPSGRRVHGCSFWE